MITKLNILQAIQTLGLTEKDICIHTSLRAFGDRIEGGADTIIDTFLEQGSTILVPSFSYSFQARPEEPYMPPRNSDTEDYAYFLGQEYGEIGVYDVNCKDIDLEEMGHFPKCVLERTGSIRGKNPINSFTALGTHAARLVEKQSLRDVYAPLQQLYEDDGCVLLMGVDLENATAIHYAEQVAGRVPFVRWAKDASGRTVPVSAGSCSGGFGNFREALAPYEKTVTVGKAVLTCYPIRALVDTCVAEMQKNPRITHCGDPECGRCNDAVLGGPILPEDFWDLD